MKWYHGAMILLLLFITGMLITLTDSALPEKHVAPARSFPAEDDVEHRKLVEEYNKFLRVMNEICPKRQEIPQCRQWCEKVDCKE